MGNNLATYLLVTKNQNIASGYKFFFILMTNDVTHDQKNQRETTKRFSLSLAGTQFPTHHSMSLAKVRVNFHGQPNRIWNHHGNTLWVCVTGCFQKGLGRNQNWGQNPEDKMEKCVKRVYSLGTVDTMCSGCCCHDFPTTGCTCKPCGRACPLLCDVLLSGVCQDNEKSNAACN